VDREEAFDSVLLPLVAITMATAPIKATEAVEVNLFGQRREPRPCLAHCPAG